LKRSWEVLRRISRSKIKRIPKKDAKRLLLVLDKLVKDPYQGDIKKIKGEENTWRRRVGNYRILYEILPRQKSISVYNIQRRTTITYR